MSIRERKPGVWQIRAYAGVDANGKARYEYKTFTGTKSEARKEELRLKAAQTLTVKLRSKPNVTLVDYAARWMDLYVYPSAAPGTITNYTHLLNDMILPVLGSYHLRDLNTDIIQNAFNIMPSIIKHPRLGSIAYSPTTISKAYKVLANMLHRARRNGYMQDNPTEDIILPRRQVKRARAMTKEEIIRFVQVAANMKDGCLLIMALLTGMRKSELLQLTWSNVDLLQGIVLVRAGGSRENMTKTEAGIRNLTMPKHLVELLCMRYKEHAYKKATLPGWNPKGLLFPAVKGTLRRDGGDIGDAVREVMCAAGIDIPGYRFHDLRHTHGSLLIASGVPITAISDRLGHSSLATTIQVYLHDDGASDAKAAAVFDESIIGSHGVH